MQSPPRRSLLEQVKDLVLRRTEREPIRVLADYKRLAPLCNGAQTGLQCEFYWIQVTGEDGLKAPDGRPLVRRRRFCTYLHPDAEDLGKDSPHFNGPAEVAFVCSRYLPSDEPYNKEFEEAKLKPVDAVGAAQPVSADQAAEEKVASAKARILAELEDGPDGRVLRAHVYTPVQPTTADAAPVVGPDDEPQE